MGTTDENRELVRRFHERLWGEADLGAIDETFTPDAVTHWGDFEGNTRDAVREDAARYFAGFTDVSTELPDLIAEGDRVVMRWRTTGTHTGDYGRIPPTGKRVVMEGVDIFRIDGDRIVEAWSMWDGLSVYQQLGLVPEDIGPG